MVFMGWIMITSFTTWTETEMITYCIPKTIQTHCVGFTQLKCLQTGWAERFLRLILNDES